MSDDRSPPAFDPRAITRPDPVLLTYYVLVAILTLPGFPIALTVLLCKYHTLRYRFDDKGVSMSWGVLFRREIYLTYRRIQDIHVTRNILHRWLGLATISVQTASGSAGAEMAIEGIREVEQLRDFLYAQMRGARGDLPEGHAEAGPGEPKDEALAVLVEIRDELRRLRIQRETN
ncbi:MAG TPA: PH domain-containing protein [Phycisphaerae bacterium]|nr:PH domain-containing protein [Phycisphaerae bacterium]HRY66628.1 PH domain-containing protein [Phycisphaerae bacterium]HSA29085.1 PH domain-containing protein [Phycisphaerae bacterium]